MSDNDVLSEREQKWYDELRSKGYLGLGAEINSLRAELKECREKCERLEKKNLSLASGGAKTILRIAELEREQNNLQSVIDTLQDVNGQRFKENQSLRAENEKLRGCNEAMRKPMKRLRNAVNMPAEGEGYVIDTAISRLSSAIDLLRELEWVSKGEISIRFCPVCNYPETLFHKPGCKLAAMLEGK